MPDATPARPKTVRARHAASLLVYRESAASTEILMGLRGARHRFMPNRLVFPGGAVDHADLSAPSATGMSQATERALRKRANPALARGIAMAAARELREETGLSLGDPPALDGLDYLGRAVTPPGSPIRFNARFLCVPAARVTGTLGGDGELEDLKFWRLEDALALDLATPTRRVLGLLQLWLRMNDAERAGRESVPVLKKDRGWVQE